MPPRRYSRHQFTIAFNDGGDEERSLSEREPFRYQHLNDNRQHTVAEGETLWSLAGHYFAGLPRPSSLWWIIADFQPVPIDDPTIALEVGSIIVVPSERTVVESIFSETRRNEVAV